MSAAPSAQPASPKHGGRDILKQGVTIPNAGGGLRDALAIDTVAMAIGDEGYIVLHYQVTGEKFTRVKDTNGLEQSFVLTADEVAFVDGSLVADHLADQAERIKEAKAFADAVARREAGTFTIEEEALEAEHLDGQHASDLRDGCPSCDAERATAEDELASKRGRRGGAK